MLDGINSLIGAAGDMWNSFMNAPLYGSLTWGTFLIACCIMDIFIVYCVGRFKGCLYV